VTNGDRRLGMADFRQASSEFAGGPARSVDLVVARVVTPNAKLTGESGFNTRLGANWLWYSLT